MARNQRGFTLIEMLIVVVVIGILAAIALVKGASTKDAAKVASLKSDIHNIEIAEEAYYSDLKTYGNFNQLKNKTHFVPSSGNTVTINANARGYKVTVKNTSISKAPKSCVVTVGRGASVKVDGVITCS